MTKSCIAFTAVNHDRGMDMEEACRPLDQSMYNFQNHTLYVLAQDGDRAKALLAAAGLPYAGEAVELAEGEWPDYSDVPGDDEIDFDINDR